MSVFLTSFLFVLLAELGDKTQLVSISLATKYKPLTVICGIFLGSLLSHSIAVILGSYLVTLSLYPS
jgi:putative Ca2+/H+ antiporter (TMEM165/GDT1 family)